MSEPILDDASIAVALVGLNPAWTGSSSGLQRIVEFADFPTAVRFIDEIVAVCEERDHHPDLALSWREITIKLVSHSAGGVTAKDVDLAQQLDQIVSGLPLAPEHGS